MSGVYDLHAVTSEEADWGTLRCRISDDAYEDGYYEVSYWLSGKKWTILTGICI